MQGRIFFTVTTLHGLSWYIYWSSHYVYPYQGLAENSIPSQTLIFDEFSSYVSIFGQLAYLCIILQVLFSLSIFRRNLFELFYYLHHIFIFIVIFSLIHSYLQHSGWNTDQLLYYILPGLTIYIIDRINRIYRSYFIKTNLVSLTANNSYYENLTIIEIRRSKFNFKPGQYCFLNVPAISKLQWHPFSITSELGAENLTFHIKSYKEDSWCGRLNKLTKKLGDEDEDATDLKSETSFMKLSFFNALDVKVDGPYGVGYFQANKYQNLIFICGGIGITPVISILQTLISSYHNNYVDNIDNNNLNHRKNNKDNNLKNNEGINDGDYNIKLSSSKTIHLLWVVSEAKNLLWFGDFLLNLKEIEQLKTSPINIKVHLFVTRNFDDSTGNHLNGIIRVPRRTPPTYKVYPSRSVDDEINTDGYEEDRSGGESDSFINYYQEKERKRKRKKKNKEKKAYNEDIISSVDSKINESLYEGNGDIYASSSSIFTSTNSVLTNDQSLQTNLNYQSDNEDEQDEQDEEERIIHFHKGRPNVDRFIENIRRSYVSQYRNINSKIAVSTLVCGPLDLEIDTLMACKKYSGRRVNSKINVQFKFTSQTFIL